MTGLPVRPVSAVPGFGVAELSDLLGIPFSDEQVAAVTAPLEPFVVVAGAGSGKTTVMTARVVWLVATGQLSPEEVLGLTFTTKAAGELAGRVRAALRSLGLRTAADGVDEGLAGEPVVATYHAFAGRLLAEHGLRIGVEPQSRLLGEAASYQLAHRVVTGTRRDLSGVGVGVPTLVAGVRELDGELAEHCLDPAALREHDLRLVADVDALDEPRKDARLMRERALQRVELSHLVDDYRRARAARDVVDFSDQMRLGALLAEQCPEVGEALRLQFRVVLLDEYQDTSVAQRRLLTGLFGGGHPVTAVGDPLQAIYGWRGASVDNIDSFPQHFPRADGSRAATLTLAENRRSGARILAAANLVAQPLRVLHPQVAPLLAADARKGPGEVRVALLGTHAEELDWVADQVVGQIAAGTEPSDVAVLVRATSDLPALVRVLADRGVAVEVRGVDGLLTVPEVVEVLCVLDVLHDSTANPSLVRLLSGPRWRIGPRDLALLGRRARQLAGHHGPDAERGLDDQLDDAVGGVDPADVVSLLDALDDPGPLPYGEDAVRRFAELSAEIRALRRHVGDPLADLVHRVVTTTGLDVELSAAPELVALRRAEGLDAFVDLVAAFQDSEGATSVGAFLAWLRLAERYEKVPELDRAASPGAVQLMTVHRAKGLEWPVVVLPSLTAGVFPSAKGRTRWPHGRSTLPYPLRGDAHALPRFPGFAPKQFQEFRILCREHDEREERRLAYVAVTRAERLVVASASWWGPTQKDPRGPSAYLDLLRDAALDGAGTVEAWAPPPAEEAANPVLDEPVEVSWPVVADPGALARRRDAAEQVRSALGTSVESLRAEHAGLAAGELSPLLGLDAADLETVRAWDDDIALLLEERLAQRAPVRVVAVPSSLSASDLVRLAEDPDAFASRLARPVPVRPAPAARRGTRFHAWVEAHYGVRPLIEPDDLPGAADHEIDGDGDLAEMQQAFLAGPWAGRQPVQVEVPFSLVLAGRVVPGRIDAVFAVAGDDDRPRYQVVDWKTSRTQSADPLQLAIYRVAWAELAGVPVDDVEAVFVYVRDGASVRVEALPDRAGLEELLAGGASPG